MKELGRFRIGEEFRLADGREGTVTKKPGPHRVAAIVEGPLVGKVVSLPAKLRVFALETFSPHYGPEA